jgi:hypothetical protein
MVKVLPRDSNNLSTVGRHLDYIGRKGVLALEDDQGERIQGRTSEALLEEWDLDLEDSAGKDRALSGGERRPAKLVHKLMFSMPPGTPPEKVLGAVRNFARETFWGEHRYAMVLHTDEAHPHVHFVLKAVSEQGVRLNIKKATLREWRAEFAHQLRLLGVQANATERAVRGESRKAPRDGIYRAAQRGESTYLQHQTRAAAAILKGGAAPDPGKATIVRTRDTVLGAWREIARAAEAARDSSLAQRIQAFVSSMPPARTELEWIASEVARHRPPAATRDIPHSR